MHVRNLVIYRTLISSCFLLFFMALQLMPQGAWGQIVYANSQSNATYSCGALGCGSGTGVTNPANAVNESLVDSAIIISNKVVLGLNGGNAYLQMQFPSPLPAGSTIYIKVGTPTVTGIVTGLLGVLGLVGTNIYVDAYNGGSSISSSPNNNLNMFRNGNGELFLVITPPVASGIYNAVRIRVEAPADLVSSVRLPVYYAKYDTTITTCTEQPLYTNLGETSGVSLNLSDAVSNPHLAIDNSEATFSALTTGAVALGATVQQTVYFNGLSHVNDEIRVLASIPASLLSLDLLNNIKVQTYNGTIPASVEQSIQNVLLDLDLLTLFGDNKIIPVYFTSASPFDRVVISCSNIVALLAGTVNVYDIKRVPGKPAFTLPLNDTVYVCSGSALSVSVDAPSSGTQLKWYASALPADVNVIHTGNNYVTPLLTTATTYWVATARTGCTTESERVPLYVLIHPLPSATFGPDFYACQSLPQFYLNYSNIENSPVTYSISWSTEAEHANFLSVSAQPLSSSPLNIAMPVPQVAAGTYNGVFYLKNDNNCERSFPFSLTVRQPPDPYSSTTFQ